MEQLKRAGISAELIETFDSESTRAIGRAATRDELDWLIAVGGDGTLHQLVNGLFSGPGERRPRLTIIPVGTGNDYVRALDQRASIEDLLSQPARGVGLIKLEADPAEPRWVINNLGAGFLATAAESTNALPRGLARRLGSYLPYLIGGLRAAFRHRPVEVELQIDDQPPERGAFDLIHLGLGPYCGGGVRLVREARPENPEMSLCLVQTRSKAAFTWLWPKLEKGLGAERDGVIRRRCKRLTMSAPGLRLHLDGELHQLPDSQTHFSLIRDALCVEAWLLDSRP